MKIQAFAAQDAATQKSLYDRLGGKQAITAVVDEFVGRPDLRGPQADLQVHRQGHEDRAPRLGHQHCGLQRTGRGSGWLAR